MIQLLIGIGIALILLILLIPQAVKIVREYQRVMVFRLGRALGARGPGLVLLIPFEQDAYNRFRNLVQHMFPKPLPDHPGNSVHKIVTDSEGNQYR